MAAKRSGRELMIAKINSSGLNEADAKKLGFELLSPEQVKKLFPKFNTCSAPGVKLPYFDVDGRALPTYRVRLLGDLKGPFGSVVKLRYLQPEGTPPAVYLPKNLDWPTIVADPQYPILITEGEFKAACAAKHQYSCIGLGGVSSWRSAKQGVAFLPQLEAIAWKAREVTIAYDSDSAKNPDVANATAGLVKELRARGARVKVAQLPELPGNQKTGLDDLIVAAGAEALEDALAAAASDDLTNKLWELNERCVVVQNPGAVYFLDGPRGAWMTDPGKFKSVVLSNLWAQQRVYAADGTPRLKRVRVAEEWMDWEQRAQVEALTYEPGQPRITGGCFNTWNGWGVEPVKGDIKPWRQLLDHLFKGAEPEARIFFERWCLWPLARPGAKLHSCAALWSKQQGLGKSLVGKLLGRVYGGTNFSEVSQKELDSTFNGWQAYKQLVMFDDVSAYDARGKYEALKKMITAENVEINIKGIPTFSIPDHSNFYLTSNKANAFYVEDDDRRFFIHEITSPKLPRDFFDLFYAWMGTNDSYPEPGPGPAAILHYAQEVFDFGDFQAHDHAPRTRAKVDMIEASRGEAELWIARLAAEPDAHLRFGSFSYERDLFTASELHALFDASRKGLPITVNAFGIKLREQLPIYAGGQPLKVADVSERFYVVRNVDRWAATGTSSATKHVRELRAKEQGGRQREKF